MIGACIVADQKMLIETHNANVLDVNLNSRDKTSLRQDGISSMSAKTLIEVLKEIEKQLNWKGPNGKVMGHVVIPRSKAEILFSELSALVILSGEINEVGS